VPGLRRGESGASTVLLACGAGLQAAAPLGREVRKTVTVLFCDVTDSTALGERLDPEALRGLLARYFETMRGVVERHGGTVEKFIGDAVMAVFGVPAVHEDDALRAARAAVEMRDALPTLGVAGRIGVTTGEVVTGTEERLATGDPVNVAARLQQAAGPGEVLISASTFALIRDAVSAERLAPVALKGKSVAVEPYRLLDVSGDAGFARQTETPLVGRAREQRLLADAWERAVSEGSCHLFTVLGPAGVGKSRLVAEFLDDAGGARVVRARCLPYGEGITYWPVVEVLEQLDGVEPEGRAAAVLRPLLDPDALYSASTEETAWAFRKLVEAAAVDLPVIVVFDDVHWGEETFLELVESVADLSRGVPILLLCMARPELLDRRPGWGGGKVNASTLLLEPLSPDETDVLVVELAGTAIEAGVRDRIREAAEGNPLFVEQMVALLQSSTGDEVVVPPTIQALLAARLDQLDPAEREVLQCGAVEGRIFHRGGVQALTSDQSRIEARLTALVRKEFVRPDRTQLAGDDAFRFRHLLIRDAAYDALSKAARAELHERFAGWLEEHGADLVELDEILGYHLEQACRYRRELGLPLEADLAARARNRLGAAGGRALVRADWPSAGRLLERALALVPENESRIELEVDLVLATFFVSGPEEARRRASDFAASAAGSRRAELAARIAAALFSLYVEPEGATDRLTAAVDEAMPVFESAGDDFGLWFAFQARAEVANMRSRWDEVRAMLERALVYARRTRIAHLESVWIVPLLGSSHVYGGTPASELLEYLESQEAAHHGGIPLTRHRITALGMLGRSEEARALIEGLCAELREQGATLDLATTTGHTGIELELLAENPEAAVAYGLESCALHEAAGERAMLSTVAAYLALALVETGRLDDAVVWADRAAELGAGDDAATQQAWRAAKAQVLARRGALAEGARLAREAVAIAQSTDSPNAQGSTFVALARVQELAGDRDGAMRSFESALEAFERKENLAMAAHIRGRLSAL
jgi:class 3 adenylate cyclase